MSASRQRLAARGVGLVTKELAWCVLDRAVPVARRLPHDGRGVTSAWLESAVGAPAGSIRSVTLLDEHHGTAGRARVAIDADPSTGLPSHLFVKFTPRNLQQHLLMNVMDLGLREVLFYRSIAGDAPIRVPRCYGVQVDDRRGRNAMVLEDLSATARFRDIREPCSPDEAAAVADALADLHAAFWGSPRFTGDLAPLVARSAPATYLGEVFVRRILGDLKGQAAELVPPEVRRASRILLDDKAAVDRLWASEPRTLLHGDTHLGNLFFEGTVPGFLDWQAVMAGPGIRDLAYFVNASVDSATARAIERGLVDRYAGRLAGRGVDVDAAHLWERYRAAVAELYIAAVVTSGTGNRMQDQTVSRVGVERVVAAVQALDTFEVLRSLALGRTR